MVLSDDANCGSMLSKQQEALRCNDCWAEGDSRRSCSFGLNGAKLDVVLVFGGEIPRHSLLYPTPFNLHCLSSVSQGLHCVALPLLAYVATDF
jgi:hypothetical protein